MRVKEVSCPIVARAPWETWAKIGPESESPILTTPGLLQLSFRDDIHARVFDFDNLKSNSFSLLAVL